MDKNLRNTHVRFKSYLNNIGGQVIPFTNNFNKERVFITIAVRRFNLQFAVCEYTLLMIFGKFNICWNLENTKVWLKVLCKVSLFAMKTESMVMTLSPTLVTVDPWTAKWALHSAQNQSCVKVKAWESFALCAASALNLFCATVYKIVKSELQLQRK